MNSKKMPRLWYWYLPVIAVFLWSVLLCDRAVTAISESRPLPRKYCIVIDPGHGGIDGGAISCTGIPESKINLEIALRLEDLLHLMGYDTVMTRKTDTSIHTQGDTIARQKISDLKERVRIANETENGVLISIHQNMFVDSQYRGAQVFYASAGGSEALAGMLQNQFVNTLNPGSRRKSKSAAGIYLMEQISCTGILVECGFLSNPEEEALLRRDAYQKQICTVIAATVSQYLSNT